ncbi:transcription elongation factor GreA [Patescibacteria group bacterium]|nr:MAG: transcription elongation factor GreA [Patescibacteria group bacterium]
MVRYLTKEGLQKLNEELEDRRTRVRQEIATAIKEAKEQGDLSENAEYAEAKSQQAENEARIGELELNIKNSQVVEVSGNSQGAQIGSRVSVKWNGSQADFQIVGSNEADPASFKISNESPMGQAFMGKKKGDKVSVNTPAGKVEYKILDLK